MKNAQPAYLLHLPLPERNGLSAYALLRLLLSYGALLLLSSDVRFLQPVYALLQRLFSRLLPVYAALLLPAACVNALLPAALLPVLLTLLLTAQTQLLHEQQLPAWLSQHGELFLLPPLYGLPQPYELFLLPLYGLLQPLFLLLRASDGLLLRGAWLLLLPDAALQCPNVSRRYASYELQL